jgi:hypothetical protein
VWSRRYRCETPDLSGLQVTGSLFGDLVQGVVGPDSPLLLRGYACAIEIPGGIDRYLVSVQAVKLEEGQTAAALFISR